MREIPLDQSTEWKMALDNLEQMHPRYLAVLLHDGGLRELLTNRVLAYFRTLERLRKAMPNESAEVLREIAQAEHLTSVNPNWQEERGLTPEEKKLLIAFEGEPE